MKKIIFCSLILVIFQQCTDELHEIDAIIPAQNQDDVTAQLEIGKQDIPLNSFSAFYYYTVNQQEFVSSASEARINHNFKKGRTIYKDLGVHWIGDFEFENGDYEISVKSDETIKVILDENIVFEGPNDTQINGFTAKLSLNGIHRLKVFYNLSSEQKVEKIIEYYKKLNEEKDRNGSSEQHVKTSIVGDSTNSSESKDVDVSWVRL